eukprot:3583152-Rhodomonas_salina.3
MATCSRSVVRKEECVYTSCYCEENVYLLCQKVSQKADTSEKYDEHGPEMLQVGSHTSSETPSSASAERPRRCWAIWISNKNKQVAPAICGCPRFVIPMNDLAHGGPRWRCGASRRRTKTSPCSGTTMSSARLQRERERSRWCTTWTARWPFRAPSAPISTRCHPLLLRAVSGSNSSM